MVSVTTPDSDEDATDDRGEFLGHSNAGNRRDVLLRESRGYQVPNSRPKLFDKKTT